MIGKKWHSWSPEHAGGPEPAGVRLEVQEWRGSPCPCQQLPPPWQVSNSGDRPTWVQILPLCLTSCGVLGECWTQSEPQIPPL